MAALSEHYIGAVVANVAKVLNLVEWKFSQQKFENKGQNYFGVLIPVVLIGLNNGREVNVPLVLKLAPTDQKYRVSGAVTLMFAREIFVYSRLLVEYKVQQRALTMAQYTVPACYYVCGEYCSEAIVLQDMTAVGYRPYTESFFLDFDHLTVSLKSLAKFHANSFVMKNRNTEFYKEAIDLCLPLTEQTNKRFMEIIEDRLCKAIQKFENTKYARIFEILKNRYVTLIEAASSSVECTCICHGDIWKENILYKYEDNTPVSACLIDYQTARMSSPAYDVLFLIATSTETALRHKYFYKLLEIYYQEFSSTLKEAGLSSEEIYSKPAFEKDLKTVGPACLVVANTALWLASGLQQEGHVRSKLVLTTEEEIANAMKNYKTILIGLIDDFVAYQYLSL